MQIKLYQKLPLSYKFAKSFTAVLIPYCFVIYTDLMSVS